MIIKEKLTEDQYNSLVNCMNEKEKYEYHNKGILPECFTKQSFFLDIDNESIDSNLIEIRYEYNKRSKKDILIDIKQDNDLYVVYYNTKLDIDRDNDLPAMEWFDGRKCWYKNGKEHRLYGPAIEWPNGIKSWYIDGKNYTKDQYDNEIAKIKLKKLAE